MEKRLLIQILKKLEEKKEKREYERLYSLLQKNAVPVEKEIPDKGSLRVKK
ncbi:MAG: hypothetical protein HF314_04265 [Ignavibacteria bacterium]|jgi:uncharacterized protein YbaR (Trm112 family)|nr:hypothetical protein [Ignavibacteria bacterium]MCU7502265.1 hypothetical protein [Ignavibacteria bacterium]MCU7516691.1 hypothetical protein [Ignavibacteria bacterium]